MTTASNTRQSQVPEPSVTRFLFADIRTAPVWALIRVYLGFLWLMAGIGKLSEPGWLFGGAGDAVRGFAQGAMAQTAGEHAQVTGWYAGFLEAVVMPLAPVFAFMVVFGEIAVGLALIAGLFTGIAAFFGGFMNASFLFAGSAGANPLMFILAIALVLAWRVAGYWGLDRWALPFVGVPGAAGSAFRRKGQHAGSTPRVK